MENQPNQNEQEQITSSNQQEQKPGFVQRLQIIDLFSFLPTPKANTVSTTRSIIGSMIILVIFLSYTITSLVFFITKNAPRINQQNQALDSGIYQVPQFAITYVYGDNLKDSFYDPKYFTYQYQQVTIFKDPKKDRIYTESQLLPCSPAQLAWLGSTFFTGMLCPKDQLVMQGNIYTSDVHMYGRIVLNLCLPNNVTTCADITTEITPKLQGGRIFLFIKKDTDETTKQSKNIQQTTFNMLNFYLIPYSYQRSELVIQKQYNIIRPDYLNRFTTKEDTNFVLTNQNYFDSQVPNPKSLYLIWFRLDQDMVKKDFVYETIIDLISMWGALWGVIYAFMAFYLLRYNQNKFYREKPSWQNFDLEIGQIQENTKKINTKSNIINQILNKKKLSTAQQNNKELQDSYIITSQENNIFSYENENSMKNNENEMKNDENNIKKDVWFEKLAKATGKDINFNQKNNETITLDLDQFDNNNKQPILRKEED